MDANKYITTGGPNVNKPKDTSFSWFLLNSFKEGRDKIALVNGTTGECWTYRELLQKSVNLAVCLRRDLGLGKDDVVGISSENRQEFFITSFAVFLIGGVVSTLSPTYSKDELKHAINLSRPQYLFCSPLTVNKVKPIADDINYIKGIVLYGQETLVGAKMFNDFLVKNENINSFYPTEVDPIKDHLAILCSSGTSGLPKGVMLTHDNFLHVAGHLKYVLECTKKYKDVTNIFCLLPWFHAYGFIMGHVMMALHYKFVFSAKFKEETFLKTIQDQKITIAFVVPPMVLFLAKNPLVEKYDMSSLKELWCGAAPLSRELQKEVIGRLQLERIKQGYGMTEMTLAVTYDTMGSKPGSSGVLAPGVKGKVVDPDTGNVLGPNQEGELCFKSATIMKGYVGDSSSTKATIDSDGWLHTGDIGYYDDENFFYVIDRVKELIKYKGFQVPPAEIEALLIQHKGVKHAAVIGLPDTKAGELPLAFIVKQPNSTVTEKDLQDFVSANISPAKRLRGGIRFVEEIPISPSGKILRRTLREQLKKELRCKL